MFKSCCARPNKKISKSKSKSEKMDSSPESDTKQTKEKLENNVYDVPKKEESALSNNQVTAKEVLNVKDVVDKEIKSTERVSSDCTNLPDLNNPEISNRDNPTNLDQKEILQDITDMNKLGIPDQSKVAFEETALGGEGDGDTIDPTLIKKDLARKRYSVDFKKSRLDFKRFSVDFRPDTATLEELTRLEHQLSQTNFDVRPGGRRKSTGILKSTTSSTDVSEHINRSVNKQEILSDDDEVFEDSVPAGEDEAEHKDPPATPVGRDELALRRHRFFSDLVCAARAAVEHRVRFDPLGPVIADPGEIIISFLVLSIRNKFCSKSLQVTLSVVVFKTNSGHSMAA